MSKPKVDATRCLEGKRHNWEYVADVSGAAGGCVRRDLRWCSRCGSLAEFYKTSGGRWKRFQTYDSTGGRVGDEVEIPACHK